MKKAVIGFIVFVVFIFILAFAIGNSSDEEVCEDVDTVTAPLPLEDVIEPNHILSFDSSALEIPNSPVGLPEQILLRYAYTTSYNKETKCPNWVAWNLTKERLIGSYSRKGVPYYEDGSKAYGIGKIDEYISKGDYLVDLEVSPRQEHSDWDDNSVPNNSHGHICPAADNKWSKTAMNQSFLLTNMCPQDRDLNGGDWEGLESRCRGWARHYDSIYIVAGPIFEHGVTRTMGKNKVAVPDAFFKVILCIKGTPKGLGFIFPNEGTHHPLEDYMLPIDQVEEVTGFDFFHLLPDDIENKVESSSNLHEW